MNDFWRLRLYAAAFLTLFCVFSAFSVEKPSHSKLPNIDKRAKPAKPDEITPARTDAVNRLRNRLPGAKIDLDDKTKAPKFISSPAGFLTGPNGQGRGSLRRQTDAALSAQDVIKSFVDEHAPLFGHDSNLINRGRLKRDTLDSKTGLRSVVLATGT